MSSKEQNNTLVFGVPEAGKEYRHRPGAYAVLYNDQGEICLVNTPEGYALPGGGIEGNEVKEQALLREIEEETGYTVTMGPYLGTAFHYKLSSQLGYVKKECFYYACAFKAAERERVEQDHYPEWWSYTEALEKLKEKEQAHHWAIETFFASATGL